MWCPHRPVTIVPAVIDGDSNKQNQGDTGEQDANRRSRPAARRLSAGRRGRAGLQVPTLRVLAQKSLGLSVMEKSLADYEKSGTKVEISYFGETTAARNRGSTRRPARVPTRSTTSTRRTSPNSRRPTGSCRSSSTTRRNTTTTTSCPAAARCELQRRRVLRAADRRRRLPVLPPRPARRRAHPGAEDARPARRRDQAQRAAETVRLGRARPARLRNERVALVAVHARDGRRVDRQGRPARVQFAGRREGHAALATCSSMRRRARRPTGATRSKRSARARSRS